MKHNIWGWVAVSFVIGAIVSVLTYRYIHLAGDISFLIGMIVASALLSGVISIFSRILSLAVSKLTPEQQRDVARVYGAAFQHGAITSFKWHTQFTVLAGQVFCFWMPVGIMMLPDTVLWFVKGRYEAVAFFLCLATGFLVGWIYWSIAVTVWRWWATHRRGMSPEEVQWRGERSSILWPKGHWLQKTELGSLIGQSRCQNNSSKNR